jgi:hypothetical protein
MTKQINKYNALNCFATATPSKMLSYEIHLSNSLGGHWEVLFILVPCSTQLTTIDSARIATTVETIVKIIMMINTGQYSWQEYNNSKNNPQKIS